MAVRTKTPTQLAEDFVNLPVEAPIVLPRLTPLGAVVGCDRVTLAASSDTGRITLAYVPLVQRLDPATTGKLLGKLLGQREIMNRPEALCAALADMLVRAVSPISYRIEVHVRSAGLDVTAVAER